jgi:hypothetical protein
MITIVAVLQSAPTPWQTAEGGAIVDANGKPIAILASRIYCPRALAAGPESWRPIADRMASAPELEAEIAELADALAELIDYTAGMLSGPLLAEAQWGGPPDCAPNGPALQNARAAHRQAARAGDLHQRWRRAQDRGQALA